MKPINDSKNRFTQVLVNNEGEPYHYKIDTANSDTNSLLGFVHFQHGPIKEYGVNGCHNEDLLNIVKHRLEYFQRGPFACGENAEAITAIDHALWALNSRTADRQERGVEGTSEL